MSISSKEEFKDNNGTFRGYDDRDLILSNLNEAIDYIHNKAMKGRITNEKNEKVRIQWFKSLAYACSIYNQIKRDIELDQLKDQMETLKNQIENMEKQS